MTDVPSYTVRVWIAGDRADAIRAVREFCQRGSCWTVSPTEFVYTHGQESGVVASLIHYPRFPSTPEALWSEAVDLGHLLRDRLFQKSFSVEAPDRTEWFSLGVAE
jgi:hypothetical protein